MTTPQQRAANRANAQKSTGPQTSEGKARSAQNALQHGLTAQRPVLPDEDPAAFIALQERLWAQYRPATAVEEALTATLVHSLWRLQRVPAIEALLLHRAGRQGQHATLQADRAQADADRLDRAWGRMDAPVVQEDPVDGSVSEDEPAMGLAALGFWEDARQAGVLHLLSRYESRLFNQVFRALHELERQQQARVDEASA
jgi:hypothetical protein